MLQFVDFTQNMQAERAKAQAWLDERETVLKRLGEAQAAVAELEKLAKEYSPEATQKVLDYMTDLECFLFRTGKNKNETQVTVSDSIATPEATHRPDISVDVLSTTLENTVLRKEY